MRDSLLLREFLIVVLVMFSTAVLYENKKLRQRMDRIERIYLKFVNREVNGKPLQQLLVPGSFGVVAVKSHTIACAAIK